MNRAGPEMPNHAATPSPVRLSGVRKWFDGVETIAPLDLEIESGASVALTGPSGCGKTTVLRLIGGLEHADEGSAATGRPGSRGAIGFCFQEPRLLPWRTVRENVALPLELVGRPRAERLALADEALELVRLSDARLLYPDQLSGGMRMRASIARALVARPGVLLLDEPFGALDEVTRQELDGELRALWMRERFTLVVVTHSLTEAAFLADRVVVFSPKPARVVADLQTPTGPRDRTSWTDPALQACVRAASDALHGASPVERRRA